MESTPTSLPSPPFIPMEKIPNFRTIGPVKSQTTGRNVRRDFIYRCAAPQGPSEATAAKLQELGMSTFYDLRSGREIEALKARAPITEYEGVQRVFAPVFLDRDSSPVALARRLADYADTGPAGFVRAYSEILEEGVGAYRVVFEHVRDRPQEPMAVHCTAGKDRTGIAVMLMLNLVGVADEDIATDYNLTEIGMKDEIERWIPFMLKEPAYKGDTDAVRRSLSARKESMLHALIMLREKWGGAEGYLKKGVGFSDADVEKIRENILEKQKAAF